MPRLRIPEADLSNMPADDLVILRDPANPLWRSTQRTKDWLNARELSTVKVAEMGPYTRHSHAVREWAHAQGCINPRHPKVLDYGRLRDLGLRVGGSKVMAERLARAGFNPDR